MFRKDAFHQVQIESKLWLCEELEALKTEIPTIWIYGGWYALSALLLLTRQRIKINSIISYDIDPRVKPVSDIFLAAWKDTVFRSEICDCTELIPQLENPHLIINTAVENFRNREWFEKIPQGTMIALQTKNFKQYDSFYPAESLDEFQTQFPLGEILYKGQKIFEKRNSYTRFMMIGIK